MIDGADEEKSAEDAAQVTQEPLSEGAKNTLSAAPSPPAAPAPEGAAPAETSVPEDYSATGQWLLDTLAKYSTK